MNLKELLKKSKFKNLIRQLAFQRRYLSLQLELLQWLMLIYLVRNFKKEILLTWRGGYYSPGWHIPGGIVRLRESLYDRIELVDSC